jgi:DNA-binding NtrC family response regulator
MTISKSAPAVLYIDDRPTLLELRKATLESHGLSLETVLGESAAMKTLEETWVDAVLLEYKQEGMDGEAIAYHIHQRFPNLPIILISAYYQLPERILWLVDEYVMRSEMPEGLLRAIERVTCSNNPDKAHKLVPRSSEPAPCKPAA